MDAGVMVPLGAFALLAAGWYIQARANIAQMEALSRERVAAMEKGLPVPAPDPVLPKPPERPSHPLKSTIAVMAIGIALWVGLPPEHRVWGMVVSAFGTAGLTHWLIAGREEWRRQQVLDQEMHDAYVHYLTARSSVSASRDGREE
jgi:hypothetical protein